MCRARKDNALIRAKMTKAMNKAPKTAPTSKVPMPRSTDSVQDIRKAYEFMNPLMVDDAWAYRQAPVDLRLALMELTMDLQNRGARGTELKIVREYTPTKCE